jgi:tetratricopeptide (TPR) repeat protein
MRRIWLVGAFVAVALGACERTEVVDDSERCLTAEESEAKIEACTIAAQNEALTPEQRSVAFSTRGDAHNEAGDVTAALRDFGSALELDGENPVALIGRGRILLASGQLDAAEPVLRRAIELNNSGQAHELIGQILLRRGEFSESISSFNAALNHEPRSAIALAGRARAKQLLGDLDGAANDYNQAIRANDNLAEARAGRCWLDLNQDRELHARAPGCGCRDRRPIRAMSKANCAAAFCNCAKAVGDAKTSFDAALAVESGNPIALFGRGVARRRSGDNDGTEDMNQARDFDGNIGQQFDELGVRTY